MANNVEVTAGSGTTFKTTDNAGVHTGHINVDSSALPSGASTAANQTTIIGHLDGVEGILTTIDGDTGTIATNSTTIAGAVSGTEMQVDVVAALPAGNNNIGDVDIASIAAGNNNIGNVDLAEYTAIAAGADDVANATQGLPTHAFNYAFDGTTWDRVRGTSADGLLVNLGSNNDVTLATLPDTAGGALAAIATDAAAIEALLTTIDADTGGIATSAATIAGAVSGTEMQVDVLTVPADPFGANADAASATGSISAKLRGIATALGITALDLGSGTGGSRTLRFFKDTAQWIGGAGNVTSATMRATLAADDPAVAGLGGTSDAAATAGSTGSINAKLRLMTTQLASLTRALDGDYETVAAGQTDQMLGATGAAGDYLAGVLIIPATTSPGGVSIEDGSTNIPIFTGGADSVTNLVPFFVPLGIVSVSGGWEITTGSNVSVIGVGSFT